MKAFVVTAVFPYPLYSGGQVRLYNLLKNASKKHEITLFSFIREREEENYKKNLPFCKDIKTVFRGRAWRIPHVVGALTSSYPFLLATYNSLLMKNFISEHIQKNAVDIIHIEPGYVWPSLPDHIDKPLVVSEHNVEHTIYEQYKMTLRLPLLSKFMDIDTEKMKKWEKIIWQKADSVVAVSQEDKKVFDSNGAKKTYLVPNGVDDSYFIFTPKKEFPDAFRALFIGDFRWVQNRDAISYLLNHIWPTILSRFGKATLTVVGREFPESLRSAIHPSVTIKNTVEHIKTVYNSSDVLLAPIRIGGGTKYKILEAMASGLPVVTTRKGIEGIHSANKGTYIVEEGESWADAVLIVKNSDQRLKKLSLARKIIESFYTWKTIASMLNKAWEETYEEKNT